MKRKLLGVVLSVAMVATMLAGCGAKEAAPAAAAADRSHKAWVPESRADGP